MLTVVLLTVLASALSVASGVLAWMHVRRVTAATSADTGALANALKRVPADARLGELARRAPVGSWEHELANEVLTVVDPRAKIAIANDALAELDHVFRAGAGWAPAGLRVAFLGCLLIGLLVWLLGYGYVWSIAIVGVGAVGALVCLEAKRSAGRRVEATRRSVDDLIDVTLGHLLAATPARSRRRSSRS